jgi:hypothetical protein
MILHPQIVKQLLLRLKSTIYLSWPKRGRLHITIITVEFQLSKAFQTCYKLFITECNNLKTEIADLPR